MIAHDFLYVSTKQQPCQDYPEMSWSTYIPLLRRNIFEVFYQTKGRSSDTHKRRNQLNTSKATQTDFSPIMNDLRL